MAVSVVKENLLLYVCEIVNHNGERERENLGLKETKTVTRREKKEGVVVVELKVGV